jgi:hypothetical protein
MCWELIECGKFNPPQTAEHAWREKQLALYLDRVSNWLGRSRPVENDDEEQRRLAAE